VSQPEGKVHTFAVPLDRLQPSQLYINAAKLRSVQKQLGASGVAAPLPLPVIRLGKDLVLTDGHTRAFAVWLDGVRRLCVAWDADELDLEAYEICVDWCMQQGIRTIPNLRDRVVDPGAYQSLWLDRCAAMHRILATQRAEQVSTVCQAPPRLGTGPLA
jgi:hypothetical protein